MSEYQYYEFLAIDRSLDRAEIAELRALSTRAEITPTRFANEYNWGDFKGSPERMMERYFDAHVLYPCRCFDAKAGQSEARNSMNYSIVFLDQGTTACVEWGIAPVFVYFVCFVVDNDSSCFSCPPW